MADRVSNVLFLCTGNSARSIMAEALLTRWGGGRFRAFSAGSRPKGEVHPLALETLREHGLPAEGFRSKSWNEFAASTPGAPEIDFVFTVCGNAAEELCPVWPGRPAGAHWGVDDPAAVSGSEADRRQAFRRAYRELEARIRAFAALKVESLDRETLQRWLVAIATTSPPAER